MNIIDLFAGAGGFSRGFELAGFHVDLAMEIDEAASETYKFNHPQTKLITTDISHFYEFDKLDVDFIDGVIGGPPCQGFSLSGKRDPKDPRNSLFVDFVRFVKYFRPNFFVMENVPGLLSMKTRDNVFVKDIILDEFEKIDYNVSYRILNAAEFGVPQLRKRVFFFGVPKSSNLSPDKLIPLPELKSRFFISIEDALSDLPIIESGEKYENKPYLTEPKNDYQKFMRLKSDAVFNHTAMKHTNRLLERFKIINNGQSLKDVPLEHMQRKRGDSNNISGKIYSQNNMRPYYDKPSPTIAASFQSNYIHPTLNRNFTAREAARLQSFSDDYIFMGKRTTMSWEKNLSQYQQIGNAVPPLLSKAIAKQIITVLKESQSQ